MNFNFERLIRTVSSEQYAVYTDDQEPYAEVDIHYGNKISVGILLFMEEPGEVKEENVFKLMADIETKVISSYSSDKIEVYHTVSTGEIEGGYSREINKRP